MKRSIFSLLLLAGAVGLAPSARLAAQVPTKAANGKRIAAQGEVKHSAYSNGPQGRSPRTEFKEHPAVLDPTRLVTQANLTAWGKELSNWGRWGKSDQKGTLNLITPQKTIEAAALVKTGRVAGLSSFLGTAKFMKAIDTWQDVPARWWPINLDQYGIVSANDAVHFGVHDGIVSTLNALCHYYGLKSDPTLHPEYGPWGAVGPNYAHQNSTFYNGYPYAVGELGCENASVEKMGLTYATRGVLYDIPALRGTDWLDPTTPIFVEDLEDWERFAGVKAGTGDAMLVRTGRYGQRAKEGPWKHDAGGAGLHASVLPWLKSREMAVVVGDAWNDVQPSGVKGSPRPIHQVGLVILGLPLVDNANLEDVAKIAQELKRWEFMVAWKTFDIIGGSGSPWNANAIF